jgi:hypothetical protein
MISLRDMGTAVDGKQVVTTASSDGEVSLSIAAIAFIIVGGVFFVALVVLVIILLVCLFPRGSVKKTFVPAGLEAAPGK